MGIRRCSADTFVFMQFEGTRVRILKNLLQERNTFGRSYNQIKKDNAIAKKDAFWMAVSQSVRLLRGLNPTAREATYKECQSYVIKGAKDYQKEESERESGQVFLI